MSARHTVADHLMDRLAELGAGRIFGVPGDYSLGMLDHVVRHPVVEWTGCTNELNAGYAADGYARLRGVAALCTTFGVGELSAINAVAGSYAEHVPVVHVVGAPALTKQALRPPVHHTLGDGEFGHFLAMHADITCARTVLTPGNAVAEIDRVLVAVRDQRLPGYLLLAADVAEAPVEQVTTPLPPPVDGTDPEALAGFTEAARRLLGEAGSIAEVGVLAGLLVHRFDAGDRLAALLRDGAVPHATTPWAKSLLDESASGFAGTYSGAAGSTEQTRRVVEDAAALVLAGVQFTDLNSGLFTQRITRSRTIELGADAASVGAATFAPVTLPAALEALAPLVAALPAATEPDAAAAPAATAAADDTPLDQDTLWTEVSGALRAGDVVLADQGTCFYGMAPHRLPTGVTFVGQPLWASIGYTLPALLGVCTAAPGRRGVLLIGDGAAQTTVQELSTVMRLGLPALVVVVDNDGYTVERAIHGPDEPYNDIARWDWTAVPAMFGGGARATAVRATTAGELRAALACTDPDGFTLVQAVVPRDDVPELLATLTRALGVAPQP
ncbi:MAG: alpha-keto acid decarboxylase family protein [Pseudonocardia sp.]|uniref:alpha-keto acid decarboxylase family protein n=1 Tax=unclassified Pseudonocardia TaxID=2619320 RepID=UPI00086ADDC8|nr:MULTISPECIES: thiamine pyrophosphate-binding protein [unclassified Pseudonocardia]MBN9112026.1 alpha-keto acid decarboxylase family protein [Pseudonocardia sp.]ODU26207.1 MAG: indolepyruvate decarboxylase [Pseudonocardia sp. SCN 72-51]ODV06050.1 MAG: indolepyruvate decarboxylase [Pseudonocardia sp. SCN 73-27]